MGQYLQPPALWFLQPCTLYDMIIVSLLNRACSIRAATQEARCCPRQLMGMGTSRADEMGMCLQAEHNAMT